MGEGLGDLCMGIGFRVWDCCIGFYVCGWRIWDRACRRRE